MKCILYFFLKPLLRFLFKLFFGFEVRGAEKVPDDEGAIVASNHASYLDPPLIGLALKRQAVFMAKESLFNIPLLGCFVGYFSFPVRRGKPQPSTIKEAVGRLRKGELIVIFPEGGISMDGDVGQARRGVGMIAAISRSKVVPAFIEGSARALPLSTWFIRPAKVRIIFGDPMEIMKGETEKDFQQRVSQCIMAEIRALKTAGEQ